MWLIQRNQPRKERGDCTLLIQRNNIANRLELARKVGLVLVQMGQHRFTLENLGEVSPKLSKSPLQSVRDTMETCTTSWILRRPARSGGGCRHHGHGDSSKGSWLYRN